MIRCSVFPPRLRLPAVFTVEASMLMGIILPVLLSLIYLGLYFHDNGVLQASCCETAALADCSLPDSKRQTALQKQLKQLGKSAVLAEKNVKTSLSLNKNFVQVSASGSMKTPGILPQLFGAGTLSFERTYSRKLFHPADSIRKIRGLKYLSSKIKGKEGASP